MTRKKVKFVQLLAKMAVKTRTAIVCLLVICAANYTHSTPLKTDEDILKVLNALDHLLTYLNSNLLSLNLDGLFGVRVIEGGLTLQSSSQTTN